MFFSNTINVEHFHWISYYTFNVVFMARIIENAVKCNGFFNAFKLIFNCDVCSSVSPFIYRSLITELGSTNSSQHKTIKCRMLPLFCIVSKGKIISRKPPRMIESRSEQT